MIKIMKRGIVTALSFVFGVLLFGALLPLIATADSSVMLEGGAVQESYKVGSLFSPTQAAIKKDGEVVEAKAILHFPNGKAYSSSEYVLEDAGNYTLEYKGKIAGETKSFYKEFSVVDTPDSIFTVNGRGSVSYQNTEADEDTYGAFINVSAGDTITYKKVIDLSKNTKNNALLRFSLPVEMVGTKQLKVFQVILTDIYNPENQVKIQYRVSPSADDAAYILAGATGQQLTGIEWRTNKIWRDHIKWGAPTYLPFAGETKTGLNVQENNIIAHAAELFFDYEEKTVYVRGEGSRVNLKEAVVDLDDKTYMPNPWLGFTTGEVELSIKIIDTQTSKANIFVLEVNGESMQNATLADNTPPKLMVDTQEYNQNDMPQAVVNRQYNIFNATALDYISGNVPVDVSVYFGYGTTHQVLLDSTKTSFVPAWPGDYTVVYRAKDYFGNLSTELLRVKAVKNLEEIVVVPIEPTISGVAGISIPLADLSISGGSDSQYDVVSKVLDPLGNEVSVEKNTFTPKTTGNYKVQYTVTDYVGNIKTIEYSVAIGYAQYPIFDTMPVFPRVLYKDYSYTFAKVSATDYKTGNKIDAVVSVDSGTGFTNLNGYTYTPSKSGDIKVRYNVFNEDGLDFIEETVKVVELKNGNNYNRAAYFIGDNITATAQLDNVAISAKNVNAKCLYATPLIAEGLDIRFAVPAGGAGFEALKITLTDSQDSNNVITVTIGKNVSAGYVSVNGDVKYAVVGSFGSDNVFQIVLHNEKREVYVPNQTIQITKTLFGEMFEGFTNTVWVEMEFIGVTSASVVKLSRLNYQMNFAVSDTSKPIIFIEKLSQIGGAYELGDMLIAPKAVAVDAFVPNATVTLTVQNLQGKVLTSADGTKLQNVACDREYEILVKEYGGIVYIYTATDGTYTAMQRVYNYSYDAEKPTISLKSSHPTTAKKGEIKLPDFDVQDNYSEAEDIKKYVVVKSPKSVFTTVKYDEKEGCWRFQADEKGEYIIFYQATDEEGNKQTVRCTLKVS